MNLYNNLWEVLALRASHEYVAGGLTVHEVADIGLAVRHSRHRLAISQLNLAMRVGVGRRFVSELESGKETVRATELIRVCSALGLSLSLKQDCKTGLSAAELIEAGEQGSEDGRT